MRLISSVAVEAWEAMLDMYCCCIAKTWRCKISGFNGGAAGCWEHGGSEAAAGLVACMLETGERKTAPTTDPCDAPDARACAARSGGENGCDCGCAGGSDANWVGGVRKRDCLACCRNGVSAHSSRESDREDRLEHLDVLVWCFLTGMESVSSWKNCVVVENGGATLLLDGSSA